MHVIVVFSLWFATRVSLRLLQFCQSAVIYFKIMRWWAAQAPDHFIRHDFLTTVVSLNTLRVQKKMFGWQEELLPVAFNSPVGSSRNSYGLTWPGWMNIQAELWFPSPVHKAGLNWILISNLCRVWLIKTLDETQTPVFTAAPLILAVCGSPEACVDLRWPLSVPCRGPASSPKASAVRCGTTLAADFVFQVYLKVILSHFTLCYHKTRNFALSCPPHLPQVVLLSCC